MENINITFNGCTADEAAALVATMRPYPAAATSIPVEVVVPPPAEEAAVAASKPRRGCKPKETDATPPSGSVPLAEPVVQTSIDDVRKALSDLLASRGMTECSQLLAEFGAARIGDLQTDKYVAVVAACKERQA